MKRLCGITNENIHYWNNTRGDLLISNENNKKLLSFIDSDKAINWLYVNGFKESARVINSKIKGDE